MRSRSTGRVFKTTKGAPHIILQLEHNPEKHAEVEERGIYGEASPDEAKALIEEGIAVHPLPRLPEDGN